MERPATVPIKETAPAQPTCSYGITKLAIEKYLGLFEHLHGLGFLVFRLSNPFGERQRPGAQGAVAAFIDRMLRAEPIEIWATDRWCAITSTSGMRSTPWSKA
jgi:UDP-glucose 4-epimerase